MSKMLSRIENLLARIDNLLADLFTDDGMSGDGLWFSATVVFMVFFVLAFLAGILVFAVRPFTSIVVFILGTVSSWIGIECGRRYVESNLNVIVR